MDAGTSSCRVKTTAHLELETRPIKEQAVVMITPAENKRFVQDTESWTVTHAKPQASGLLTCLHLNAGTPSSPRDLNDDPELWALTEQFGDRSLRIWLEILALIDRHENRWRVSGDWVGTLSRKCRVFGKKVSAVIDWLIKNEWLCVEESDPNGFPLILASRNYWKFHKRREPSGAALASDQGSIASPDGRSPYS